MNEEFFIDKIKNQAAKEGANLTKLEEKILLTQIPTPGANFDSISEEVMDFYKDRRKLVSLNNKVISLLQRAMNNDFKHATEIKSIRLGWLKWFKMPADWHDAYMNVYNTSNKAISGILQNFVIGNPVED